jgi:hypothetical protein
MALLNPVYGLIVPCLCIFTVPLAIFAGITTALAFSVLMFRVTLVYLDIAIAFVPQYIMGRSGFRSLPSNSRYADPRHYYHRLPKYDGAKTPTSPTGSAGSDADNGGASNSVAGYVASGYRSPRHRERTGGGVTTANISSNPGGGRRSRRPSQGSVTSIGTITPINEATETGGAGSLLLPSSAAANTSVGMNRDFEGIGGWRLDDSTDDSDWAKINSRLELPLERTSRHHRSPSAGPATPVDGSSWLMMKSVRKEAGSPGIVTPERDRSAAPSLPPPTLTPKSSISPNSSRVRINQSLSSAFSLRDRGRDRDSDEGYFPAILSPKSKKSFG